MLIPKYWAQYKQRFDSKIASSSTTLKQATIKRYGWSDVSQEQALLHAKQRVADAQNRWLAGEDIVCRERKEQYNQENGIPIREQIIAEHDFSTINSSTSSFIDNNLSKQATTHLIVTRNSYGAQVANVDNIAIIDVDAIDLFAQLYPEDYDNFGMKWFWEDALNCKVFDADSSEYYLKLWTRNDPKRFSMKPQVIGFVVISIVLASIIAWLGLSWLLLIVFMAAMMSYLWRQASKLEKSAKQESKQKMMTMLESIDPFMISLLKKRVASHANEQFRLYKTPAGFRIIATHDTVLPNNEVVAEWFVYFYADANYARLCQSQQCFRARLTAKPWRMIEVIEQNKMEKDIPSRDFFFIDLDLDDASINALDDEEYADFEKQQNELAARQQWIEAYDNFAKSYRSCEYIESFAGVESKLAQAAISDFIQWHDSACQVDKDLPLA